jgi:hypothetical protein
MRIATPRSVPHVPIEEACESNYIFIFLGNQFYMQTYAVGVGSLSDKTTAFVTNMSSIVTNSMPGVQFGAYAGYVECVAFFFDSLSSL